MSNEKKGVLFKTKLFGFEKKAAMDYIAKIKLENDGLKTQLHDLSVKQGALLKENAMLRSQLGEDHALSGTAFLTDEEREERADASLNGALKSIQLADSGKNEPEVEAETETSEPEIPDAEAADAVPETEVLPEPEPEPEPEPKPEPEPVRRTIVSRGKIIKKKDGKTYITSVK